MKKTVLLAVLLTLWLQIPPLDAVFNKDQLNSKRFINVIFILDCSASMNKIIGSVRKIDIAKKTLETVISSIAVESHEAGSMKAGLRVFGSKFLKWKKNCDDTVLEVPLDDVAITRDFILVKIRTIRAIGQSSLTLTIEALKGDFPEDRYQSNFIVVISDGDESCGGNPCTAVAQLVQSSQGVSVSTLGVEAEGIGRENLNCMAEAGNGLYFDSKDVNDFILFLKDCNNTIQENRRTMVMADTSDSLSTELIQKKDVTTSFKEYKVDSSTPLYPDRDDRFAPIDSVRPQDKVLLITSRGLWLEVFCPEKNIQGWILAKTGGGEYSVTVTDDRTPLYLEKSPSSSVVTYLNAGEQLTVLKKEGAWYNVFSQNRNLRGWVIAFNVVEH